MYLLVPDRTARGPSNGPYDSNVRQPIRRREPKAHRRYYRGSWLVGSWLGARAAPAARATLRRARGWRPELAEGRARMRERSGEDARGSRSPVQLRKTSAISDLSSCGHPACAGKDTRERREGTLETRFSVQGIRQRTPVFLTSPNEVPTLTPFSSSACGRPPGGAARGAGRSDRRRRSRHVRVVLPALHPPLGLSSPWDDPGVRSSEDTGMPTGTIARLLIDKGFGFIRDESGIEHFFHRSSVRGAVFELLREGQRVEFTPEESGKGPRAGEVRLIEG